MSLFATLSEVSRARKLRLFHAALRPGPQTTVLDLGGETSDNGEVMFLDVYPWKERVTAVNLCPRQIATIRLRHPQVTAVVADARDLPWPDKYFDAVYSNAVIEHVGGPAEQRQMAKEIMRVAKSWFVTTPNRWFPFEFHLRLPLVTWLPFHGYRLAGRVVRYGHVVRRYVRGGPVTDLRLLGASELRRLFPGSRIVKQRTTVMAETLIAIGGEAVAATARQSQGGYLHRGSEVRHAARS